MCGLSRVIDKHAEQADGESLGTYKPSSDRTYAQKRIALETGTTMSFGIIIHFVAKLFKQIRPSRPLPFNALTTAR